MKYSKKVIFIITVCLVYVLTMNQSLAAGKILREKITDPDVVVLQKNLQTLGQFPVNTKKTGYFGSVTKAAVMKYQLQNKLKADGIVTPLLFQKINESVKKKLAAVKPVVKTTATIAPAISASKVTTTPSALALSSTLSAIALASTLSAISLESNTEPDTAALNSNTVPVTTTLDSVSRGSRTSFLSHWFDEARNLFTTGMDAQVYDVGTGKTFMINYSMNSANHADCETKTAADTQIMLELWDGTFKSMPRPVILTINGQAFAASVAGKPHCGLDNLPFLAKLVAGDAYGDYVGRENCDKIKGNLMNGHFDVHFYKSRNHYNNLEDPAHQRNVLIANDWALANMP